MKKYIKKNKTTIRWFLHIGGILMKIYVISGKARHGKDTVAMDVKEIYEGKGLKVINLSYGSYIKEYAKKISNWDGTEETKPRELLQELGTDVIRKKIDNDFFVRRICEDIKVYSYYFDIITISDARFPNELEWPKKNFDNVINIRVIRDGYDSVLSEKEQKHLTEVALDEYNNYDYVIHNDGTLEDLRIKVSDVVRKVEHEY